MRREGVRRGIAGEDQLLVSVVEARFLCRLATAQVKELEGGEGLAQGSAGKMGRDTKRTSCELDPPGKLVHRHMGAAVAVER